jgi:hypothetical protein
MSVDFIEHPGNVHKIRPNKMLARSIKHLIISSANMAMTASLHSDKTVPMLPRKEKTLVHPNNLRNFVLTSFPDGAHVIRSPAIASRDHSGHESQSDKPSHITPSSPSIISP